MRIAIITGASSGMGRCFAQTVDRFGVYDEVWVIARRRERLEALALPYPKRVIPLDLTLPESLTALGTLLAQEQPQVGLLVNAGGFGLFRPVLDSPAEENRSMVALNCQALMGLCQLAAPYMPRGSQIINIASMAALQPVPYIAVYGATKAFVLSFSRALGRELRSRGVAVLAVCPFWTQTEFFDRAVDESREAVVKRYAVMYQPEQIVARAWRDAKRGREVSIYGATARAQALLAKLLPHRLIMTLWQWQQGLR